jgi:aspartyl-tRNA(Asn)/glutamyl-tRNA(Gln) amidotransferase subunit A
MSIPNDPVVTLGIDGFAAALRRGDVTSEQAVRDYLARIKALNPLLGAFEHVDAKRAVATARAMDGLLACGVDLGPLMGLPISVKDLFVIDGMPTYAGSNLPISDRLGKQEGTFIRALREAGCVILGTTRMVEFALGITGHSTSRGTPWNPWDDQQHRLPGGSSSGAGVALVAGLCALSVGSDTGGSVRVPAAMNGLFGLKTTVGLWPTDGAFPLEPDTDSIGLLTRSAADAAIAFKALNRRINPDQDIHYPAIDLERIAFGIPEHYLLDGLDPDMEVAFASATARLEQSGAMLRKINIPNVDGRERYFPLTMAARLLAWLGEDTFYEHRELIDPVIRARIERGLNTTAHRYLAIVAERQQHIAMADPLFENIDVIISPTTQSAAMPVDVLENSDMAMQAAMGMTRNTQPANYFGWCAVTLPMGLNDDGLPLGLQLNAPPASESRLLAIAAAVESVLGRLASPTSFRNFPLR